MIKKKYNLYPPGMVKKLMVKRRWYLENYIPNEKYPIFIVRQKDFDREFNDSKNCLVTKDTKTGKLNCFGFEIEVDYA